VGVVIADRDPAAIGAEADAVRDIEAAPEAEPGVTIRPEGPPGTVRRRVALPFIAAPAAGTPNTSTDPSRLATTSVSSSRKHSPCGPLSVSASISTAPFSATSALPAEREIATSKTAILLWWKAATARRRLLGENWTSSVRPRSAMTRWAATLAL
jgi:hypothetical protein